MRENSKLKGGAKFLAIGRGQSPRGLRDREARPDYINIDDLDDDDLCKNERRVKEATEWVKEALFGALDAGRGRFIMVGNLISKNLCLLTSLILKVSMSRRSKRSTGMVIQHGQINGLKRKHKPK